MTVAHRLFCVFSVLGEITPLSPCGAHAPCATRLAVVGWLHAAAWKRLCLWEMGPWVEASRVAAGGLTAQAQCRADAPVLAKPPLDGIAL